MALDYRDLIDLDRYPLDRPGAALDAVVSAARDALGRDGCVVLPGFLIPHAVELLTREADGVADKGHRDRPAAAVL